VKRDEGLYRNGSDLVGGSAKDRPGSTNQRLSSFSKTSQSDVGCICREIELELYLRHAVLVGAATTQGPIQLPYSVILMRDKTQLSDLLISGDRQ
jgi:hypothetical protein